MRYSRATVNDQRYCGTSTARRSLSLGITQQVSELTPREIVCCWAVVQQHGHTHEESYPNVWHGQFDHSRLITVPYSRPTVTTITSTRDVLCAHMSRPCSSMDTSYCLINQAQHDYHACMCGHIQAHTRDHPHLLPSLTASNHSPPVGGVLCSQVQDLSSSRSRGLHLCRFTRET